MTQRKTKKRSIFKDVGFYCVDIFRFNDITYCAAICSWNDTDKVFDSDYHYSGITGNGSVLFAIRKAIE